MSYMSSLLSGVKSFFKGGSAAVKDIEKSAVSTSAEDEIQRVGWNAALEESRPIANEGKANIQDMAERAKKSTERAKGSRKKERGKKNKQSARQGEPQQAAPSSLEEEEIPTEMADEVTEGVGREEGQLTMDDWGHAEPQNQIDPPGSRPQESTASQLDEGEDEAYSLYGPGKSSEAYDEYLSEVTSKDDIVKAQQPQEETGPRFIRPDPPTPGSEANKSAREEFLKDSKAGTSLGSHALDYLIAPTVGAGIAGTQKALEYDNESDPELKGLPLTGRANAFIKGATHGAAVGLGGVAATKGLQSGLARSVGSRSKSLTSSFLMGLDVAPKSGKWSDWAQRSASKTRAVSETVNKAELRGSMDIVEEELGNLGKVEEQLNKDPIGMNSQQARDYSNEATRRVHAAKSKKDIAAQKEWMNNATPQQKKAVAAGAKVDKAERRIASAKESFQTYAPANADKEGALNGSARKTLSEMPNLGAFYMGQFAAGVDASLSVGKKFYSENVAPPPKEGSSSFFKRRNPAYLSAAEGGKGEAVSEYHGKAMSGGISALHGLGGLGIAAGAIGVAAGTGASSSASGGGFNHPMNVLTDAKSQYMSAQAQMQGDASERVRMTNPGAIGLNDIEENYFTNPSMSPKRGRHTPGKYNDTGNLTLALSTLRRG